MAAPYDYNPRITQANPNLADPFAWSRSPYHVRACDMQRSQMSMPQHLLPHEIAFLQQQGMGHEVPKPQPEPKAENTSERSALWSEGTSLSLKGGMQKVMESGEYSDLTILCEDQHFSVHKVVVCSQSKVLAAAMKKGFKESELSTIDLSEDGISLVSHLISFLYTGNYAPDAESLQDSDSTTVDDREPMTASVSPAAARERIYAGKNFVTDCRVPSPDPPPKAKGPPNYSVHVEMYALSDQYDIPALGTLAKAKLDMTCMVNWHAESFLEIIPRVYESTLESNQGLRGVVLDHARKHSNDFMEDELLKASFRSLLAATPEFGAALLTNYMTDWTVPPPSPASPPWPKW